MNVSESNRTILKDLLSGYLAEMEERYVDAAKSRIKYWSQKMEEAGWDMSIAVPYPKRSIPRTDFYTQLDIRQYIYSITAHAKKDYYEVGDKTELRKPNPEAQEATINSARIEAQKSFDGYINKLIGKIDAEISDAKISGILWNGSVLTITTTSGEVQNWK